MMTDEPRTRSDGPREPGRLPAHEAVDRLIELASDPKPETKPARALALKEPKDSDQNAMWKALLQLKALLPYASRLLPLLELAGISLPHNAGVSKEMRESITGIQAGQRDLRLAVQDQTLEIKRLEEEIARLRGAAERAEADRAALSESVKANRTLIRTAGSGLAVLLIALIVMVAILLSHQAR